MLSLSNVTVLAEKQIQEPPDLIEAVFFIQLLISSECISKYWNASIIDVLVKIYVHFVYLQH